MRVWTRPDKLLVGAALVLTFCLAGYRLYEYLWFERAADDMFQNIAAVAEAVSIYHEQTGRWFPKSAGGADHKRVYLDPFRAGSVEYQGLDETWLWRENNHGMVLQLVRFDPRLDRAVPVHLFLQSYRADEPYLRVLTDYGAGNQVETEILIRLQDRLPPGSVGEVDDHYYVIDLRRLLNAG